MERALSLRSGEREQRIVSLIASATEIVCALGARERLVGRSHECDFPPDVLALPALTAPKFKVEGTSAEIDARVREIVRDGLSVYRVDGEALKALAPDVIVTQDHCEVCAVSLADVEAATCTWTGRPVDIVSLRPDCMADVYADIARVARALGLAEAGGRLVGEMQARLAAVRRSRGGARQATRGLHRVGRAADGRRQLDAGADRDRRRTQPVRAGRQAFRLDAMAGAGRPPTPRRSWWRPAAMASSGAWKSCRCCEAKPGWADLSAVRNGRVYFADGNAYFNRPGPRLADSAEMLAEMLHPDIAASPA